MEDIDPIALFKKYARKHVNEDVDLLNKLKRLEAAMQLDDGLTTMLSDDDPTFASYMEILINWEYFNDTWLNLALTSDDHFNVKKQIIELTKAVNSYRLHCYGIMQPGYASGDQFGIGFTLVNDPHADVYLTTDNKKHTDGEAIADYYETLGVEKRRIHRGFTQNQALEDLKGKGHGRSHADRNVEEGTYWVAANFSPEKRAKYRERMGLNPDVDAAADLEKEAKLKTWLDAKQMPAEGKVAVLWSRFSGKSGEAHLEHDTSYTGMAQIIAGLKDVAAVLIVGDSQPKGKAGGQEKYQKIADTFNNYGTTKDDDGGIVNWGRPGKMEHPDTKELFDETDQGLDTFGAKVIVMTEFWNDPAAQTWGGNTRTGQFLLYDYLHRKYTARHLGFRSGILEAVALLGFNVEYMEEPDSWGAGRMTHWHAQANGKTVRGGVAPGYERLGVERPANRLGQNLITLEEKYRNRQLNAYDTDERRKRARWQNPNAPEDSRKSRPRGFSETDLKNIDSYLTEGDPLAGIPGDIVNFTKEIADAVNAAKSSARKIAFASTGKKRTRDQEQELKSAKSSIKQAQAHWLKRTANVSEEERKFYERAAHKFVLKF